MAGRRGPKSANERLRRLLVMLPWIMERGEVAVAEVAERFAMSEEAVIADLERASMCGLPPFEPGDLIDLYIDDGIVYAGPPKFFTRPLRLTAPEGFALLVAGPGLVAAAGGRARGTARPRAGQVGRAAGRGRARGRPAAPGDCRCGRRGGRGPGRRSGSGTGAVGARS